jgi:hypothetical protein
MTAPETIPSVRSARITGIVLLLLWLVFLGLAADLLQGNNDLATPGRALVTGPIQDYWRLLYGTFGLVAAVLLLVGWILWRGLRPTAYIALSPLVASLLVLLVVPALVPSATVAYVALAVVAVILPALLVLWAEKLGAR